MFTLIDAPTADAAWSEAATSFETGKGIIQQSSRDGETLELLHAAISIRDPRQRWILGRQPSMNPAFAIAEVVWILAGRNDSAFVNHWNPALPRYAGEGEIYYGAYGYRLRRHLHIDQLERAFGTLSNDSTSRQVVLQIWDSPSDLPDVDGKPRSRDIPCNICSLLKARDGRLEWMQIMRSNDLFRGLPHNIVQFTSLQEVMSGWLGLELGGYHQISDSLHIYERDLGNVKGRTAVTTLHNRDSLMLNKAESDRVWRDIEERMEALLVQRLTGPAWHSIADFDGPQPFQNLFAVVLADDARRRAWPEVALQAISKCTNPVLRQLWENWTVRNEKGSTK